MKYELPNNHGLSDLSVKNLVFKEEDLPSLTDVQFSALEAGVGRGESALVVSPPSTGKTQIALWAIAHSLQNRGNTVYLVTHRALAKQKFEDFKSQLLKPYLNNDHSGLIIATGDYVEDAEENIPKEPLRSPLVIATYEKYLALLSASGIPKDMKSITVVCDEIQLIGDKHRGQHVEVLLTLLRNAGWKQFVGLSAVLENKDAHDLAEWLKVIPVISNTRDKHLLYECWTPKGMAVVNTKYPEKIEEGVPLPRGVQLDPVEILYSLLKEKTSTLPIIIFCMRKPDTYDLPEKLLAKYTSPKEQLLLPFEGLPATTASEFLSGTMSQRIASHNADLTEEERQIVQQHLIDGKLDVVFATSTLAAGVNFSFGAAIFASWERWDSDRRLYTPIDPSEFHNMAGRVGRMGFSHKEGRVIFIARNQSEMRNARQYLDLGNLPPLESRITTERFDQLALQLVGSGLCNSRAEVEGIICNTLSAQREQYQNTTEFTLWPKKLSNAIDELVEEGLTLQTTSGRLITTAVGRAIAYSGLLPETGVFLLHYVTRKLEQLIACLPTAKTNGDISRLAFLLFSACFSSPEFRRHNNIAPTRFLPYPLDRPGLCNASVYRNDLVEPVWEADVMPVNAAKFCCDWIMGAGFRQLEDACPKLRAGMILDMNRNLVWILQGLAAIITAAADTRVPDAGRPKILREDYLKLELLAKLPRVIQRLSFRVAEGLSDEVLWMTSMNSFDSEYRLSRNEILALKAKGFTIPQQIMLGSDEADKVRLSAFANAKPSPQAKANWLRDSCRNWKKNQRKKTAEKHLRRAHHCAHVKLVEEFYTSTGTNFENVFEKVLTILKISFEKLDNKTKTGAPDYLVELQNSPPLIIELKSREGDKLIDYNGAVEVLAASEVHGHKDKFCVTLCHPGVDPSVPLAIASCGRLCVVESTDLGEALLRICEGTLSEKQMWQWLASPGQALSTDLPYRDYT
jgi:helicase